MNHWTDQAGAKEFAINLYIRCRDTKRLKGSVRASQEGLIPSIITPSGQAANPRRLFLQAPGAPFLGAFNQRPSPVKKDNTFIKLITVQFGRTGVEYEKTNDGFPCSSASTCSNKRFFISPASEWLPGDRGIMDYSRGSAFSKKNDDELPLKFLIFINN